MGLPEEFAFSATYRMSGDTLNKSWNVWQMQDLNGKEQLAVRLNGEALSVEFSYRTQENRGMIALFPYQTLLFNSQWHNILLLVKKGSASLITDCMATDSQQLAPRGQVNLDGFTHIGKLKDNSAIAVPVRIKLNLSLLSVFTVSLFMCLHFFHFFSFSSWGHCERWVWRLFKGSVSLNGIWILTNTFQQIRGNSSSEVLVQQRTCIKYLILASKFETSFY